MNEQALNLLFNSLSLEMKQNMIINFIKPQRTKESSANVLTAFKQKLKEMLQ